MIVATVHTGIGALDYGLRRCGMQIAFQRETDPDARSIWRQRFGEEQYDAAVDIVAGRARCDDAALWADRRRLDERANGLPGYLRILERCQPAWVVLACSPAICRPGANLNALVDCFLQRGYSCAWRVLASGFAHLDRRADHLILVGHRDGAQAARILFNGNAGPSAAGNPQTTAAAVTAQPDRDRAARTGDPHRDPVSDRDVRQATNNGFGREQGLSRYHAIQTAGDLIGDGQRARYLKSEDYERLYGLPVGWTQGLPERRRVQLIRGSVPVQVAHWLGERILGASLPAS